MKVLKNYLYNAGYQILALVVPLITAPYISRVLHPAGVGYNAYTNSIIQYFVLMADLGIAMYGQREIAYVREDPEKMSRTFWEIQFLKFFTTTIAYFAFVIFLHVYDRYTVFLWIQSLNIIGAALDVSWLYQGVEDFKRTVLRNTMVRLLSLALIFILIKKPSDVSLYIFIIAFSNLFGNLTLWPHLRKMLVPVKIKSIHVWHHLWPTIGLFIPQIATSVYLQLNKTMLGVMMGTKYSGFYQNSDNLVKMVLSLATSLGTVMLPHMSAAFVKGDKEKMHQMLYKSFDVLSILAFAMTFGIAAVSTNLAPFFYGKSFWPVGPAMMIESIVIILIAWSNTIGRQYLVPTNQVKAYTTSIVLGAAINFVANFIFIDLWGLNGAMWATVASEAVVTGYQMWAVRKQVHFTKMLQNTFKYLIAGFVMFIPVYLMNIKLRPSIGTLGLEVVVGIIIYTGMILILKPTSLTFILKLVKQNKSH